VRIFKGFIMTLEAESHTMFYDTPVSYKHASKTVSSMWLCSKR